MNIPLVPPLPPEQAMDLHHSGCALAHQTYRKSGVNVALNAA